jgi:hypothetical protein
VNGEKSHGVRRLQSLAAQEALGNVYRERGDYVFKTGDLAASLQWYWRSVTAYPLGLWNSYMLVRALAEPILARTRSGWSRIRLVLMSILYLEV